MQYLMIICHDDSFAPSEGLVNEIAAWDKEMAGRGIRKCGNPLRPPSEAMTVRVREGNTVLKNGPFAESRDQMAAYELIECESFEEAVNVASTHPMAKAATIEVRPIWTALVR